MQAHGDLRLITEQIIQEYNKLTAIEEINFIMAVVTFILSLYLVITFASYAYRLRNSSAKFRRVIRGVSLAKFALMVHALTWIFQISILDSPLPWISFPVRVLWLIVVIEQTFAVSQIKNASLLPPDPTTRHPLS